MGVQPPLTFETLRVKPRQLVPGDTMEIVAEPGARTVLADNILWRDRRFGGARGYLVGVAGEVQFGVVLRRSSGGDAHLLGSTLEAGHAAPD
ncbi:hypothetical protein GCM10009715_35270 [Paeniglutamicibacter psychrophenolicus]|uniref:Uncharacterized protein n=1 Tax=Paeniglutamicibacter psychrophenolicus TaxID=257454 RepID=A0ABS4WA90_9MICC|nr:hypothetical protein [Paeniglutamicibacter psychrophenolicus]